MFDKLDAIEKQYERLVQLLGSSEVQSDPAEYRKHAKALSDLEATVERYREYKGVVRQVAETEELISGADSEMRDLATDELRSLVSRRDQLISDLKLLLVPKDPNDEK